MSPSEERGAFETLGAAGGALPLWERHMARLAAAARRLGVAFEPPDDLRARALAALEAGGHDVVRITLVAGAGGTARFELATRARARSGVVRLARVPCGRSAADMGEGFKSVARGVYDRALAASRAAGADDALLVDAAGRVLETATANVFVAAGSELCTPPLDGRIVPGIARAALLEGLAAAGRAARERPLHEIELTRAAGLWVTNAVHGPRPAVVAGGPPPSPDRVLERIWLCLLRSAGAEVRYQGHEDGDD